MRPLFLSNLFTSPLPKHFPQQSWIEMSEMTPLPPWMGLVAPRAMKVRPRTEEVIPRNDPGRESPRGFGK